MAEGPPDSRAQSNREQHDHSNHRKAGPRMVEFRSLRKGTLCWSDGMVG